MSSYGLLVENNYWDHTQQYILYYRKKDEYGAGLSPVVLQNLPPELRVEAMSRYESPDSRFPDYFNQEIN
jgi:hypothetical protein